MKRFKNWMKPAIRGGKSKYRSGLKRTSVIVFASLMLITSLASCVNQEGQVDELTTQSTVDAQQSEPISTSTDVEIDLEVKRLTALAAHTDLDGGSTTPRQFLMNSRLSSEKEMKLFESILAFTDNSFNLMMDQREETNLLLSPLSLYLDLAMLAEGTAGETEQEIVDALVAGVDIGPDFLDNYRDEMTNLLVGMNLSGEEFKMRTGQSLWFRPDIPIRDSYLSLLEASYLTEVYQANFANSPDVVQGEIDQWASEKTEGLIEETGTKVKPQDVFYLLQSLYFKDSWYSGFDAEMNSMADFRNVDGSTTEAVFMNQVIQPSQAYRGENFQMADLMTAQGFALRVLLPDAILDLEDLLADEGMHAALLGPVEMESYQLTWSLPKFDISSKTNLISLLSDLNINEVTGPNADFSNAADVEPGAYSVDTAIQQVRIMVDEIGIEAAALTVIAATEAGYEVVNEMDMIVDRPFAFTILTPTGLPLFVGYIGQL